MTELGPHMELVYPAPCPECGSTAWLPEMGESMNLRHYRGCSGWSDYFDGGERKMTDHFLHPAFPYENPRPAATTDKAIERAAEALHIERNRQWEAIRPGTRNPLIAVSWSEENEPFKERLRQEVRIVLAAVARASTEAILNHMADVHLTPTAEKK